MSPSDKSPVSTCLSCQKRNRTAREPIICSSGYPCTRCSRRNLNCVYSRPETTTSAWTDDSVGVERYSEPLRLRPGKFGAALLVGKEDKQGVVDRFEWKEATEQREDLRIKPSREYGPTLLYPASISGENEAEVRDCNGGDALDRARDNTLFDEFSAVQPTTPIHSTILLNALLSTRPSSKHYNNNEGPYPNYGNCLSATIREGEAGPSRVVWRSGDERSRGTRVSTGFFGSGSRPRKVQSRKGKEREEIDDQEESEEETMMNSNSKQPWSEFTPASTSLPLKNPSISPITQIQIAPLSSASNSTILGIRTHTSFSLLQLPSAPTSDDEENVSPSILNEYTYPFREIGRAPLSDFVLSTSSDSSSQGSGLLLDTNGSLFGWDLGSGSSGRQMGSKPELFRLRKGRGGAKSGFGRVVFGGRRGVDAVVASEDTVLLYDLRTARDSTTLLTPDILSRSMPYGPDQTPSVVTSLKSSSPSVSNSGNTSTSLHVICTTRDIIWLDDRMPGKEMLRWAHGRCGLNGKGMDRSLGITEMTGPRAEEERFVLHSKIQPLLSIYTYSTGAMTPTRSLLDPYSLSSPTPDEKEAFRRTGLCVIPSHVNNGEKEEGWMILESDYSGRVFSRHVFSGPSTELDQGEPISITEEKRIWSQEIAELVREVEERGVRTPEEPMVGAKQKKEYRQFDLKTVVEKLFEFEEEGAENEEHQLGLEKKVNGWASKGDDALRSIVQSEERRDRGILTAYDLIALAATDTADEAAMDIDEDSSSLSIVSLPRRSTFTHLSEPSISSIPLGTSAQVLEDSTVAFQKSSNYSSALLSGALKGTEVLRGILAPDLPSTVMEMEAKSEELRERYSIGIPSIGMTKIGKLSSHACDQLILDTTLSSQTYSPFPIHTTPVPSIEALNQPHPVDEEPPPLFFTYFRPLPNPKNDPTSEDEDEDDMTSTRQKKPSLTSWAARSLLSEWHIGSNPHSYEWRNPYLGEREKEPLATQVSARKGTRSQSTLSPKKPRARKETSPPTSSQMIPSFNIIASSRGSTPIVTRRIHTISETREESSSSPSSFGMGAATQPVFSMGGAGMGFSQPFGGFGTGMSAGSQVLPGAFGGRGTMKEKEKAKEKEKKKTKKRISGF